MKGKIKSVLGSFTPILDAMLVSTLISTWMLLNMIVIVPKILKSEASEWKISFIIYLIILMPLYALGRYLFYILKKKGNNEKHPPD